MEQKDHINVLELKAAFLVLQSLCGTRSRVHIRLQLDNTVAVAYIQNMGGRITELHHLARQIWTWAIARNIWLSAAHIPGSSNVQADTLSRQLSDDMEWMLTSQVFQALQTTYPSLEVDLFASRLNNKLCTYVSFLAMAVDAFTLQWTDGHYYAFPPFSILHRVMRKVSDDKTARMILVAPIWASRVWFPVLLRLVSGPCYILPETSRTLQHPTQVDRQHSLRKMRLGVFHISGQCYTVKDFHMMLPDLSLHRGGSPHRHSMGVICRDGCNFALKGKLIHIDHLVM